MEIALCHPAPESIRYAAQIGSHFSCLDLSWAMIQPEPDTFNFSCYDQIVAEARKLGVKLIAGVSNQRGINYFPDEHWIWRNHRGMQPDPSSWGEFLKVVVDRYKDTIRYWEVWSEPNCRSCNPMSYYDPYRYREVLKLGSRTIRAVDSSAKIVFGGLWLNYLRSYYLKPLLTAEMFDYFDIFNWHFFLMAHSREMVPFRLWKPVFDEWNGFFRARLPENCPIWVTEFGLPTQTGNSEILYTHTRGRIYGLTEVEQADWFSHFAEAAERDWGLNLLAWLMLRDQEDPTNYYVSTTGMQRGDGSPKPLAERIIHHQANVNLAIDK